MRFRSITESELVDLLYPPPHDGRGGGQRACIRPVLAMRRAVLAVVEHQTLLVGV